MLEKYNTGGRVLGDNDSGNPLFLIKCKGEEEKIKILFIKGFKESNNIILDVIDLNEDLVYKNSKKDYILTTNIINRNKKMSNYFSMAEIVYVERSEDYVEEKIGKPHRVWRVNLETGKIEEVKDLSNIKISEDIM